MDRAIEICIERFYFQQPGKAVQSPEARGARIKMTVCLVIGNTGGAKVTHVSGIFIYSYNIQTLGQTYQHAAM